MIANAPRNGATWADPASRIPVPTPRRNSRPGATAGRPTPGAPGPAPAPRRVRWPARPAMPSTSHTSLSGTPALRRAREPAPAIGARRAEPPRRRARSMMVSSVSPRMALACSSNCESRCDRSVTRPASSGPGRRRGEVDLVAAHQQLDGEHAAAAERVDDAGGDRPGGVERGQATSRAAATPPAAAVGLTRWPIGSQKCTADPDGPAVRTVSNVTSSSTSTTVSAITRCAAVPPTAVAALPGRLDVVGPQQHRPPVGLGARDRRDHQREARRARPPRRVPRPSPRTRTAPWAGRVRRRPAVRSPSRSRVSRAARGLGNTSTPSRSAAAISTSADTSLDVGDDVTRLRARRAARSPPRRRRTRSSATTTAPSRSNASGELATARLPPSSITRGAVRRCRAVGRFTSSRSPPCQTVSPAGGRHSTTASSRPARPNASPGWPVWWKCAVACWCGLESQQPTCPQVRHIRRCAQVSLAVLRRIPGSDPGSAVPARRLLRRPTGARRSWAGTPWTRAVARSPPHADQG